MSDERTGSDEHDAASSGDGEPIEPKGLPEAEGADAAHHDDVDAASSQHTDDVEAPDADADDDADVDIATDVTATDREAAAIEAAERARALQPRTVGLWGVRAAAGVATLAVGVLAVLAGPSLPAVQADPRLASIVPDAPAETRVCAGPLLGIGDASGDAGAIGVLSGVRLDASAAEQQELPFSEVEATAAVLRGTDVAGAESLTIETDAAYGAAASECGEPTTSQWLVGGATTTGRSTVLTVANPGTTATSVDVTVYGQDGRIDAVGSTGIAVAAGSISIVDLASLAPGVAASVVHVASSGGPVSAHLQHRVVRTLQPGGIEVIDPVQAATSVAIPGVLIGDATGVQTQEGFADAVPALRVLAGQTATVTITTIADGDEPIASTLDLVGGQVQEVDLSGLAPGTYAFTIESDVPIVAAARQMRVDGDVIDLDWVQGQTTAIDGTNAIAVAGGPTPRLHLLSLGGEPTTVTIGEQQVELEPGALRTVPVEAGLTTIEAQDVVAAVTYSGSAGIAGYALTPRIAARDGIDVVL